MKAGVYNRNRQALNAAALQRLQIYDNQMVRQETAKSRTKEVTQAALNSIASKTLQNKLENRTLKVYENLYNYRYDPSGRLINYNPAPVFDFPQYFAEQLQRSQGSKNSTFALYNPFAAQSQQVPQGKFINYAPYDFQSSIEETPTNDLPTLENLYQDETVYPLQDMYPIQQQKKGGKTSQRNIIRDFKHL